MNADIGLNVTRYSNRQNGRAGKTILPTIKIIVFFFIFADIIFLSAGEEVPGFAVLSR